MLYLSLRDDLVGSEKLISSFPASVSPSFSVTTHSLKLAVSRRPIMAAFIRYMDITFSNKIQNGIMWRELPSKHFPDFENKETKNPEYHPEVFKVDASNTWDF